MTILKSILLYFFSDYNSFDFFGAKENKTE